MTTSASPEAAIRLQVTKIVVALKGFKWPYGKEHITFAIVTDDKVIRMTLPKADVMTETPDALKEVIYKYMAGKIAQ